MTEPAFKSGTISQSGMRHEPGDYGHQNVTHPVLGVVVNVFCSDEPLNTFSQQFDDGRGTFCAARVLVMNDGNDAPWILPNVVILPNSASGEDNFSEELPNGTTGTIDGTQFKSSLEDVPPHKLNGDYCIVDFVGGSTNMPFMVKWFPHPGNRRDSTTRGEGSNGNLQQGRRSVKRFQGTRFAITSEGTIIIDTNEANHLRRAGRRVVNEKGGDIKLNMKNNRELEINFNPSVFDPEEPDFLWEDTTPGRERSTASTTVRFTKDEIEAIAGEVVKLTAQRGDMTFSAPQGEILHGTGADQAAVLGDILNEFLDRVITLITKIQVPTAVGPSGNPLNNPLFELEKDRLVEHLSQFIKVKLEAA